MHEWIQVSMLPEVMGRADKDVWLDAMRNIRTEIATINDVHRSTRFHNQLRAAYREASYGPNWKVVQEYLQQIQQGCLFNSLGQPHAHDHSVLRVRDWDSLRAVVDYSAPDSSPENSRYLKFLNTVVEASSTNDTIASECGLAEMVKNAVVDAGGKYCEADDKNEQFLDFTYLPAYNEPYPFCRFSVQDQCAYIAGELVVSHVTPVHLLRDMWYRYRAGHWPCGWEGNWPEGRLIVF